MRIEIMNLKTFLCLFFALAVTGCNETKAVTDRTLASAQDTLTAPGTVPQAIVQAPPTIQVVQQAPAADPALAAQLRRLDLQERQLAHQQEMHALKRELVVQDAAADREFSRFVRRNVGGIVALFLYGLAAMGVMWIQSWWFGYREAKGVKLTDQDKSARRLAVAIIISAGVLASIMSSGVLAAVG